MPSKETAARKGRKAETSLGPIRRLANRVDSSPEMQKLVRETLDKQARKKG